MAMVTFEVGFIDLRSGVESSHIISVDDGPHAKRMAAQKVEDMGLRVQWVQPWKLMMEEMQELRRKAAERRQSKEVKCG